MSRNCLLFLMPATLVVLTLTAAPLPAQGPNRVGKIEIPMGINIQAGRELAVREPSMCAGSASATVRWNRQQNQVSIHARFDGLPYRPALMYEYDPSTAYNQYPPGVVDGKWQMWIIGRFGTINSTFYYDATTGDLIANEYDVAGDPPPGSIPVELPVAQMACTDFFESNPSNLKAQVHFRLDYDRILDAAGTGGCIVGVLPTNLFETDNPDKWDFYYTEGGLPVEAAMHWDDVLDDLAAAEGGGPGGLVVATSYEPFPKPDYLIARDNIMIGWGGEYPAGIFNKAIPPAGLEACGTYQLPGDFSGLVPESD